MKVEYRAQGYATCVHSHKRQHASWRVFKTCCNLLSQPDYKLPYPTACNTCPFYRADRAALKKKVSGHA